jgi:hypothetical protein
MCDVARPLMISCKKISAHVADIAKHPMEYGLFAISISRAMKSIDKIIRIRALIFLRARTQRRHLHRCKIFFTIHCANSARGPESIKK